MSIKFKQFPQINEHFEEVEVIDGVNGSPRLYSTPYGSYPSMTSILSVIKDKSGGLDKWRERVGAEEADRITEEAKDRGNALHDYNEKYLLNNLKRKELTGQAGILFNRVKRYLDEIEATITTEAPLWHKKDKYAGRVDAIVMMDGELTIVDHKNSRHVINTSASFGRQKMFTYMMQVYGYARALEDMRGWKATKGCLIVGNYLTSTASKIEFNLNDSILEREFNVIIESYYGDPELINKSLYYKL